MTGAPGAAGVSLSLLLALGCAESPARPTAGAAAPQRAGSDAGAVTSTDASAAPSEAPDAASEPAEPPAPSERAELGAADAAPPLELVEIVRPGKERCYGVPNLLPSAGKPGKLQPEVKSALPQPAPWKSCYARALAKNPGLSGRVEISFTIERDGSVRRACTSRYDVADKELVACVLKAFVKRRFARPEGGGSVRVVYPLVFTPG